MGRNVKIFELHYPPSLSIRGLKSGSTKICPKLHVPCFFGRANACLPQHALGRGTGPDDDDDNGYAEEPCRLC